VLSCYESDLHDDGDDDAIQGMTKNNDGKEDTTTATVVLDVYVWCVGLDACPPVMCFHYL
jgi:hypothetical protein